MTQARESHDGLCGELLRQLHAALVKRAVSAIEINIRQLLGAAQRSAFDLLNLGETRIDVVISGRNRASRWQGRRTQAREIVAFNSRQSVRPGNDILEQQALKQSCRGGFGRRQTRLLGFRGHDVLVVPPR